MKEEILPIILSSDTLINGNICTLNTIRIEGTFEGSIYSKSKVIIDDNAMIKGSVIAKNIDISGEMIGNIYCWNKVYLKSGAKVNGKIHCVSFKNDDESLLNAKLNILSTASKDAIGSFEDRIQTKSDFIKNDFIPHFINVCEQSINS